MPSRNPRLSAPIILLGLAIAAYALYFSHLTITRYAAFEARALDMGNLNQAIWNTSRGNWFHFTNQPGAVNRLSLHVEPILIPISWLYRLYSAPPLLLALQAVIVALGAIPLYALARHKQFGSWAALAFAGAFLLNPSIQAANWLEFHPVTLAPTFLMAAFYCLISGRTRWFVVFAVLAASCKEEIALLVFMMGLYATIALSQPRLGLITMFLSLAWAFLAVFVIQNAFADGNIHWDRYAYLGETPLEMVLTLVTNPGLVFDQLRTAGASRYLVQILLPVAFMPVLALDILALALPSVALNLLADFTPMHQVYTLIYAATIVPFAMIAAVYGARRLADWLVRLRDGRFAPWQTQFATTAAIVVFLFALGSSLRFGYIPGGANHILFDVTAHDRIAATLINQIPPEAKVSAHDRLDPHVSGRETVYIFPRIEDADTVFLDVTGPSWPQHPNDLVDTVRQLLDGDFGVADAADGYLLLRKGVEGAALPATFYSAWQRPDHTPANPVQIDFDDALRLVDYQVRKDDYGETVTQLYWQALKPLDEDYGFYIAYRNRDGDTLVDSHHYPPAAVLWYPTSQWEPGQTTLVQTLPWSATDKQFSLMVGVYGGDDGRTESSRLAVSHTDPWLPVLDNGTLVRLDTLERTRRKEWQSLAPSQKEAARALQARFGQSIALEGATVPEKPLKLNSDEPTVELPFTLHWRALESTRVDYTVFAHLLDADGSKVAQYDWQPSDYGGPRPTTSWRPDEEIVDGAELSIPSNLTPGQYRIVVGVYDWQTGDRLPVSGQDADTADAVDIGAVEIR